MSASWHLAELVEGVGRHGHEVQVHVQVRPGSALDHGATQETPDLQAG